MRLSELVSDLTPATFTVIAMVIFLGVFVAVAIRAFLPGSRAEHAHAKQIPLDDGSDGGAR